jgi:glycosyltransferase involved in cell wall biosynthesis
MRALCQAPNVPQPTGRRDVEGGISLVLPMYNERVTIGRVVAKALDVLGDLTPDYEVLIVDDASSDGSERIAGELAQRYARVRTLRQPRNLGYGCALRTGFASAAKAWVVYTDSDEPVDLREIGRAMTLAHPGVDLVIGYRIRRHDTPRRFVYSKTYNLLCRALLGLNVRDVNFSFKLMRRAVLERIHLRAGSVFIDGELLAEALRCGYHIVEMSVQYLPRRDGKSSFDGLDAALYALQEMIGYWWRTRMRPIGVEPTDDGARPESRYVETPWFWR